MPPCPGPARSTPTRARNSPRQAATHPRALLEVLGHGALAVGGRQRHQVQQLAGGEAAGRLPLRRRRGGVIRSGVWNSSSGDDDGSGQPVWKLGGNAARSRQARGRQPPPSPPPRAKPATAARPATPCHPCICAAAAHRVEYMALRAAGLCPCCGGAEVAACVSGQQAWQATDFVNSQNIRRRHRVENQMQSESSEKCFHLRSWRCRPARLLGACPISRPDVSNDSSRNNQCPMGDIGRCGSKASK